MDEDIINDMKENTANKTSGDVVYNSEKDFYRGMSGELRMKAEGLFKKAKEKGISIVDIDISTLKMNYAEIPGIGTVELPAYMVKVKGKHSQSGQIIMDGKQIDYFNRYQKYVADKIESKNYRRDETGKPFKENRKPVWKEEVELVLSDKEVFEIGKELIEDKEFGLEKTITGACDRVIRKLMGENDWLYPEEAKLLDEEFNAVQNKIVQEENRKRTIAVPVKKATDRQLYYLKSKIKNLGLDPEDDSLIKEIMKQGGFHSRELSELSTGDMSKIIDHIGEIVTKVKDMLSKPDYVTLEQADLVGSEGGIKQ